MNDSTAPQAQQVLMDRFDQLAFRFEQVGQRIRATMTRIVSASVADAVATVVRWALRIAPIVMHQPPPTEVESNKCSLTGNAKIPPTDGGAHSRPSGSLRHTLHRFCHWRGRRWLAIGAAALLELALQVSLPAI